MNIIGMSSISASNDKIIITCDRVEAKGIIPPQSALITSDSPQQSNVPQQQQREAPMKTHEATPPPGQQRNNSGKTEEHKPMSDNERKQVDSLF